MSRLCIWVSSLAACSPMRSRKGGYSAAASTISVARSTTSAKPAERSTAATQRRVSVCSSGRSCSETRTVSMPCRCASVESVSASVCSLSGPALRKSTSSCVSSTSVQQPSFGRGGSCASPLCGCPSCELLTSMCLIALVQHSLSRGATAAKELIVVGQCEGGSLRLPMSIQPREMGHSGSTCARIASHIMSTRTQKGGYLKRAVSRTRMRSSPGW
mmetsp:Transcript_11297/g.28582  ORF Transcript_11297/g.28582 Transcript_11297/m.28582 type:complete len:216 (+) Transcript_11297:234-881(+)